MVSEVLSSFISNLHLNGLYEGFMVGKNNVHVPLLQFADNTLIFSKFDEVIHENVKKTLEIF